MLTIEILGSGCRNCQVLYDNVKAAVERMAIDPAEVTVEKVEDLSRIIGYGVMSTPALAVNGQVKSAGKVLKADEVQKLLAMP